MWCASAPLQKTYEAAPSVVLTCINFGQESKELNSRRCWRMRRRRESGPGVLLCLLLSKLSELAFVVTPHE